MSVLFGQNLKVNVLFGQNLKVNVLFGQNPKRECSPRDG